MRTAANLDHRRLQTIDGSIDYDIYTNYILPLSSLNLETMQQVIKKIFIDLEYEYHR